MTQTASQWLDSLTTLFTPLDSQFAGARTHRWSIQARLDAELGLHEMFETVPTARYWRLAIQRC